MDGYVLASDFAQVERKMDTINSGLCDGFYGHRAAYRWGQSEYFERLFDRRAVSAQTDRAALIQQLSEMAMIREQNVLLRYAASWLKGGLANTNYNLATPGCE